MMVWRVSALAVKILFSLQYMNTGTQTNAWETEYDGAVIPRLEGHVDVTSRGLRPRFLAGMIPWRQMRGGPKTYCRCA